MTLAITYRRPGDPAEVLEATDIGDPPPPGFGQLQVQVSAFPIHPGDLLAVSAPQTAGGEVMAGIEATGVVTEVCAGVTGFSPGTRVTVFPHQGSWCEIVKVDAAIAVRVTDSVPDEVAAQMLCNPITALMLRRAAQQHFDVGFDGVVAGEAVRGKTLSVVRREAAAELVRSWGGDRVVIDDENLESNLAESLSGAELDIVVDSVGGRAARQMANHLHFAGTFVSYAALSGQSASVSVLELIGNHVNWTGFWEINWLRRTDAEVVHSAYRELVALAADGTLSARVARTTRLGDWKDAVSLAQGDSGQEGKVVFVFDEQDRT